MLARSAARHRVRADAGPASLADGTSHTCVLPGCRSRCRYLAAVGLGEGEGQWSLYWTAGGQPLPCRLVPALAAWGDLDEREIAADIDAPSPILIDPQCRVDPALARFLTRSRYSWLAEGTREAYAKDYRLFFSSSRRNPRLTHAPQRGSACTAPKFGVDCDLRLGDRVWGARSLPGLRAAVMTKVSVGHHDHPCPSACLSHLRPALRLACPARPVVSLQGRRALGAAA
jgi:hypothetical protein